MSIVHAREIYKLRNIERFIQTKFNKSEIPSGKDVCRKQFYTFMDKLLQTDISNGEYATFLPMLEEKFASISKEEVLQRVAALEFDRFLKYYENAEDLNIREQRKEGRREFSGDGRDQGRNRSTDNRGVQYNNNGFARLFVNLGTKDGFYKASFLQFILDMSDLRKDVLGRIDMKEMNSWIEIDKKSAKKMIQAIDGKNYRGRKIRMNDANSR